MEALVNTCAIVLISAILLKIYLSLTSGVCHSGKMLDGKTAIITGANSGIGLETARALAERRARVILACRNLNKARKAKEDIVKTTENKNVIIRHLDLSSMESVRKFAEVIINTEERLDILVNNAGVTPPPGKHLTEDNLELQFATNHFGPFLLTNLLLPLLKKSAPSRIIVVSSITHYLAKLDLDNINCEKYVRNPFWIYSSTKLANILFTRELSKRLEGTGVTVNSLHPGGVKTAIARDATWFLKYIVIPIIFPFLKSSKSGAQTSIYLAVSEDVENISGQYFDDCKPAWITPKARNDKLATDLWNLSEQLTGLNNNQQQD